MAEIEAADNLALEDLIKKVDYRALEQEYVPSKFALKFINFIKLVNGGSGEENTSPLFHYDLLDSISKYNNNLIVAFRGSAKTSLVEYLFLYLATFGKLDGFGDVSVAMYVGDTMENGCKNLRNNIEHRYNNSSFLQQFITKAVFTDARMEFTNAEGHNLFIKMFGASPLSLDSVLSLPNGEKTTMGSCQVGDFIIGAKGTPTQIVAKSEVFHKPMYRMSLKDGRSVDVSIDHINRVIHKTRKGNCKTGFHYVEKNMTTLELLREDLYHVRHRIHSRTHSSAGKPYTSKEPLVFVPTCKPVEFTKKDVPVDPYTLGLLLGDGSLKKDGSCVLSGAIEDIKHYKNYIPYTLGKPYINSSGVESIALKGISQEVKGLGLRGSKSGNKFIPPIYKTASVEQRVELLQGLMDTDGTITNHHTAFYSTSETLINDVQELVWSLGGYAIKSMYSQSKAQSIKSKLPLFTLAIYINLTLFKLPRKVKKVKYSERNTRVPVVAITQIADTPSQCIAVDAEDHLFLTNDYIVTHNTGVRGFKAYGQRPVFAAADDLFTDKAAESKTIVKDIENVMYKAIRQALHPTRRKVVWIGTPFNKKDSLYKAAGTAEWNTKVYPICQKFPCTKAEFVGAWEDRFPYEAVRVEYNMLKANGRIDAFNQELMLRILSDDDRLVLDQDIVWYKRSDVTNNLHKYNIYMTTDFATSETEKSDFSVISVWALDYKGVFHWIDGVAKRQDMAINIDDIFRFVEMYKPLATGVEISGQQKGFVSWLKREMVNRGTYFYIASDKTSGEEGLRPNTSKLTRFNVVLPLFKQRKIAFPEELRESAVMLEFIDEISSVTPSGFKSLHDDCADTISQLPLIDYFVPSDPTLVSTEARVVDYSNNSRYFSDNVEDNDRSSYIV